MPLNSYDPYRQMRQAYASNPFTEAFGSSPSRRSASFVPPLEEEEARSMMGELGHGALNTLGYLGASLDKPGRAIRGLLTGNLREGLAAIPFSDALGITDYDQAVTGKDLLEKAGLAGEEDTWGNWGAGLATEIALDPMTYLTLGGSAVSKFGKAAKAAGLSDDVVKRGGKLADVMGSDGFADAAKGLGIDLAKTTGDEPLRGAARLKLPFMEERLIGAGGPTALENFGSDLAGAAGKAIEGTAVGRGVQRLGEFAGGAQRIGRGLFSPERLGTFSKPFQDAAPALHNELNNIIDPIARGESAGVALGLENLSELSRAPQQLALGAGTQPLRGAPLKPESLEDIVRLGGEGFDPTATFRDEFVSPQVGAAAQKLGTDLADAQDRAYTALSDVGYGTRDLDDHYRHLARYSGRGHAAPGSAGKKTGGLLAPTAPADIGRNKALRATPEGSYTIQKLVTDTGTTQPIRDQFKIIKDALPLARRGDKAAQAAADAARANIDQAAKKLGEDYLNLTPANIEALHKARAASEKLTDDLTAPAADRIKAREMIGEIDRKLEQPKALAEWVGRDLPDKATGKRIWDDLTRDHEKYMRTTLRKAAVGRATQDVWASTLGNMDDLGEGAVPLYNAMLASGFNEGTKVTPKALELMSKRVADKLGVTADEAAILIEQGRIGIPKDVAADAARLSKFGNGETIYGGVLSEIVGAVTKPIKYGLTQPFPSFHHRNRQFAAVMNWMHDAFDPFAEGKVPIVRKGQVAALKNVDAYLQPFRDATALRTGKVIDNITRAPIFERMGLAAEEATRQIGEWAHQFGLQQNFATEELGEVARRSEAVSKNLFGPGRNTLDMVQEWRQIGREVKAAPGKIGKVKAAGKGYLEGMEKYGSAIEQDNRLSAFIAYIKQGVDPQTAAEKAKAIHVDYSKAATTPFESDVMKKMFPFYQFQRRMVPEILSDIAQKPGGKAGKAIRATNSLRSEGFLPEHISGGLAIPVGGETDEGNQRFLTGVDLPFEILGDIFKMGPTLGSTLEKTGLSLAGNMNPLFKGPAELATGKQFFSGRDLKDLDSNISRTIENVTGQQVDVPPIFDQALGMSPLSRVGTTLRTLTDGRKGALAKATNLLSGARLSDVNMPQQESLLGRELLTELLAPEQGVSTFEKVYIKPENLKNLTPEALEYWRLYNALERQAQEKGRERRKKQGR